MPIVQFHLVVERYPQAAIAGLLEEATRFYVATLYPDADPPPLERVRAFVSPVPATLWATGGVLVSAGGKPAPYFTCLSLAGRSSEQLVALTTGFTDLIEKHLECERALIRGMVTEILPDHWSIGGKPASLARATEVASRAAP